ncbi:MAG: PAS domain-containing protein [Caldilineaceae bacterium]
MALINDLVNDQIEYSDIYRKIADFAADSSPTRAEWLARVHPDDQAMIEEHLQRAKAFGESYQYEYRIVHRDGSIPLAGRQRLTATMSTDGNLSHGRNMILPPAKQLRRFCGAVKHNFGPCNRPRPMVL